MRILVQRHNGQGKAVTVNGDRYRAMLNKFLFTKIKEEDIGNIWFEQDSVESQSIMCLKIWTNHVGYCMARRGGHLNEIIFHY